ncbi:hypothetical protein [Sphingobacterium kyonggiense]
MGLQTKDIAQWAVYSRKYLVNRPMLDTKFVIYNSEQREEPEPNGQYYVYSTEYLDLLAG